MLAIGKKSLRLGIIILVCSIFSIVFASSNGQSGPVYPVFRDYKPLAGEQLGKARAARDAADIMLQECMDKYPDKPMMNLKVNPPEMKLAPRTQEEIDAFLKVAAAFAEDPGSSFASQKASLIINAIKDVPKIPIAEEFYSHSYMNYGETTYSRYINALSKIKGADKYLKDTTLQVTGKTRYCVLIARANRGDVSVKKEITNILADKQAGLFRAFAAGCFRYIGTQDDIPLLQIIADSDTMERDPRVSMPSGPVFPVRTAAKDAIRAIQDK